MSNREQRAGPGSGSTKDLVLAMISVIAGFALVSIVRGNRAAYRTSTAVEIAGHLFQYVQPTAFRQLL